MTFRWPNQWNTRRELGLGLLLIALTAATYWGVSQNDFVSYDDGDYVTENPHVQAGLTREGIAWAFGRLHTERTYWHPLTWLSHMLDCQIFGLRPAAHHLMNLLFHVINVVLLFLVLRRMTGALWKSALVAALWSIHPLQVDSVAWVTERKNLLSTLFWLLTMLAYTRYAEQPGLQRYLLVVLSLALGLMCKPVLVTLPFVLLLLDFWPLRRVGIRPQATEMTAPQAAVPFVTSSCPPVRLGRAVLEKVPLLALATVSGVLTIFAHQKVDCLRPWQDFPLVSRLANAFVSYARYLKKFFVPDNLAAFYPHPGRWPDWVVWGSVLLVATLTALVVWRARRAPHGFIGWLWFLGVLVPAIGIVQVGSQSMADRFAYQPLMGLLIGIVWAAAEWGAVSKGRQVAVHCLTVAALVAGVLVTVRQVGVWRNSATLYEHAVAVTGQNHVMEHNLAVTLYQRGQRAKAKAHALASLDIQPASSATHLLLGKILEDEQQADDALAHYEQALHLKPGAPPALKGRSRLLFQRGRFDEAYAQLAPLARETPGDPEVHLQLAQILARQQRVAEASAHAHLATQLKPDWPEALNHFAWLLATVPQAELRDGPEAVRLAEHACELTRRQLPGLIGTLAAAYAEAGRFTEAARAAEEARALALAAGQTEIAMRHQQLLKLYQARQAYRESASIAQ
jgi:predicted Zn-dependent protease